MEKKTWFEKFGTALTILVSVLLTLIGWCINSKQNRSNDLRDVRNEYLSNAFRDISFYGTLQQHHLENKEYFIKYERALKDVQLYGSPEEIKLANELFTKANQTVRIDTFINLLRDDLRKEYKLDKIKDDVFWVMNEKLFKDTLIKK